MTSSEKLSNYSLALFQLSYKGILLVNFARIGYRDKVQIWRPAVSVVPIPDTPDTTMYRLDISLYALCMSEHGLSLLYEVPRIDGAL
jgi:hypothetical protein